MQKSAPDNPRTGNRTLKLSFVFIIIIIACQVCGILYQSNLTWGFHSLGFLSPPAVVFYLIFFLVGTLFVFSNRYELFLDKFSSYLNNKPSLFLTYSVIIFICAAIILRVKIPLLGDGFIYVKGYESISRGGDALIATRQPIAMLFFHIIIMAIGVFTYPGILTGYLIGEILLGAGFIVITYYITRLIFDNPKDRLFGFLFTLSFPYMQLFFGYVELYPVVLLTHSAFILSVIYYFHKNGSYFVVLLLYFLVAFSNYVSAILFVPSIIYLTYIEFRTRGIIKVIIGLSIMLAMLLLVMIILDFQPERLIPKSEHAHFLTIIPSIDKYQAYTIFSLYHIIDILNLLVLMGAPALFLIGLTLFYSRTALTDRPAARFLLLFILCLMLFIFIVKYDLPMALDWDITAPLFFIVVIYSIYIINNSCVLRSHKIYGLLILITILPSMFYYQLNSSEIPNLQRVKLFLDRRTASQSGFYQTAFHLSMYYLYRRDTENLIKLWNQYVDTYPNDADGFENLIKAYWEIGEKGYDEIDQIFKKWISIDPNNPDIKSRYANICLLQGNQYYQKGDLKTASVKFKKVVEIKSDIPGAYNNLGLIYYEYGNYDSALYYFERAIVADSTYVLGYKNMAKPYVAKRNYDKAVELFQKAISLNPDMPVIYEDMAKMYDIQGNREEAIKNYQKAARLGSIASQQYLTALNHKW